MGPIRLDKCVAPTAGPFAGTVDNVIVGGPGTAAGPGAAVSSSSPKHIGAANDDDPIIKSGATSAARSSICKIMSSVLKAIPLSYVHPNYPHEPTVLLSDNDKTWKRVMIRAPTRIKDTDVLT
jgi:hypothetical protein